MEYKNDHLAFCRSIAIMGGTFDPVHYGHLAVAEAVYQAYRPNKVLFVPAGRPLHKRVPVTPFEHRYQMALLASADHPAFAVSRMEEERAGPSYTVDTLRSLRRTAPEAEILFITGADAMLDILRWKKAEELFSLCRFITVPRPGIDNDALSAHLTRLRRKFNAKIEELAISTPAFSGTEIRTRMANGESVRYMLPRAAEDYARRQGLYKGEAFSFEEWKRDVSLILSPRRYAHTLGVVEEAERLAGRYGADIKKARTAALLHDCAKEYAPDKKRALCNCWNIAVDEIMASQIDLTHSLLSAESARRDYGVYDEEILQAIRCHTTGHGAMTLLDKLIALADFIEPTREDYPGLKETRALAYTDIDAALLTGFKEVVKFNEARGRLVHPWSRDAIESLER
jgi:nicotinate-nucleotide adenylyltransferase